MDPKPAEDPATEKLTEEERTSQVGDLGRGSHEQSQGGADGKPVPAGKTPPPD